MCREVSRNWSSTDTGIEEVLRNKSIDTRSESRLIQQVSRSYRGGRSNLDRSNRCREAIEEAKAFLIDPPSVEVLSRIQTQSRSIHQVLRCWRDCDKKTLRNLDRQLAIEEVLSKLFKNSFSRCEKHRHECNPTCNSTIDPINMLSSQNHLSIRILNTWILKNTHTHTKQV